MELIQTSGQQLSLDQVRAQFDAWRQNRDKRKSIPDQLWAAAASLYPAYSLHHISKALRLNHTKLKQCVQEYSSATPAPPTATTFIELGFDNPSPPCQCVIEMQHKDGAKMTIQNPDGNLDLMKLARLFWSRP